MPFRLPMIPGFRTRDEAIKTRHPKTPDLDVMNGVHIIRSLHVKKDKDKFCSSTSVNRTSSDKYAESKKPTWLVYDKQNLTFDAYFKSTVNESFGRSYNLRKCKIIYFLEDDTIKVVEPVVINSGLPQGCLIRRHKIPLPNSDGDDYYQLLDLNVGVTVEFYGKQFKITSADNFTRDFLKKTGVDVPEDLSMPVDPYFVDREKTPANRKQANVRATTPRHRKAQGFEGILSFRGSWDDRHNVDGSLHVLEVRYFLSDDTVQIVEHESDGGLKTFLKRQKLPKDRIYVRPPGFGEKNDLLNVLGVSSATNWYVSDPLTDRGDARDPYYRWSDLYAGAEIDVYGRKIVLSNCDRFTGQYYSDHGLGDDVPSATTEQKDESNVRDERAAAAAAADDVPKTLPSRSEIEALVFKARFVRDDAPDRPDRQFVVKCFLSDQSFAVSETNTRTAGALGCRFFSRRKIPPTGTIPTTTDESNVMFKLYVGVELVLDNFQFVFVDVEDRTLRFMMDHPNEFPHSDVDDIMRQVSAMIQTDVDTFNALNFQNRKEIERNRFIEIMSNRFPKLSVHGVYVLALQYKKRGEKRKDVPDGLFRSILQDELRRALFVDFDGLEINFRQRNLDKQDGYIERSSAFKALKSAKLPFSSEIINMLLDRFTSPETNKVAYADVLTYLNYTADPTAGPAHGLVQEDVLYGKSDEVVVGVERFVDDLRRELWNDRVPSRVV